MVPSQTRSFTTMLLERFFGQRCATSIALDARTRLTIEQVASTPDDQTRGVLDAIDQIRYVSSRPMSESPHVAVIDHKPEKVNSTSQSSTTVCL